jgi:predicted PurR-regulated permease PerM
VSRSADELRSLILWTIVVTIVAGFIAWCAYLVRGALLLIYVSGLLAIGFSPMVRWIQRRQGPGARVPRWLAILVIYVVILGFLTLVGFLIVPPLVSQARSLWAAAPRMFDQAQQYLIDRGVLHEHLTLHEAIERAPVTGGGQAAGAVAGAVVNVVGGIFGVVTILILTFYLLVDSDGIKRGFLRLFPARRRGRAATAAHTVTVKVSAWLGGQLLLATVIGTSSAIGLWALGVPYFYVLALISGVGEMIPVVGPVLAAIPAIAVAATISVKKMLLVILFFVVQQQIENHVLVPRIMSKQVGVSAATVIMALLIGGELLGILGAILAVPTAAIVLVVFNELAGEEED